MSEFRTSAGAVWLPRDFVVVDGPDVLKFLQGQLSQDLAAMPDGGSSWALLLQPQGKLDAFLRVLRESESRFVLETDEGFGGAVVERLNRFRLRVKATVEPLAWKCLAVRGPDAHDRAPGGVVADWPGLPGSDLIGEAPAVPDGVPVLSLDAYERVRIEAGIPVMGKELDESTIPAEAGIVDQSVSWTKGCYTGQELVARIDSRGGNVPRKLRGIVLPAGAAAPPPGAAVKVGEKNVGRVTSVARGSSDADGTAPVALAYVGRAVAPPADVTLEWDGGSTPVRVESLPLVS